MSARAQGAWLKAGADALATELVRRMSSAREIREGRARRARAPEALYARDETTASEHTANVETRGSEEDHPAAQHGRDAS